jgi:hypothetical protein
VTGGRDNVQELRADQILRSTYTEYELIDRRKRPSIPLPPEGQIRHNIETTGFEGLNNFLVSNMSTLRLAEWSTSLTSTSLPDPVVTATLRSFYNWLGCALGGSSHRTTTTAIQALSPFFGMNTSSILGSVAGGPARADASHAALINGIASHVHDYDDTHLETIIHPTGPVASAALAVAEMLATEGRVVSGKEFLVALVVVCFLPSSYPRWSG